MKVGLMVGKEVSSLEAIADISAHADRAGLDSVWLPEVNRSFSVMAAVVAQSTSRVRIGSCVSAGFIRSPLLNARFTADLDELARRQLAF